MGWRPTLWSSLCSKTISFTLALGSFYAQKIRCHTQQISKTLGGVNLGWVVEEKGKGQGRFLPQESASSINVLQSIRNHCIPSSPGRTGWRNLLLRIEAPRRRSSHQCINFSELPSAPPAPQRRPTAVFLLSAPSCLQSRPDPTPAI